MIELTAPRDHICDGNEPDIICPACEFDQLVPVRNADYFDKYCADIVKICAAFDAQLISIEEKPSTALAVRKPIGRKTNADHSKQLALSAHSNKS
jgi:hypothetical protein